MKQKTNKKMLILSAIGILMVVVSHTGNQLSLLKEIFPFTSFFMPMFIFISGYFYKPENENKLLGKDGYILKKIKKLIIPYFIWNLFYGVLVTILRHYDVISYGNDINLKNFFIEPWLTGHQYMFNLAAWFIPALFLVNITYILVRKLMTKCKIWNDNIILVLFFILMYISVYFSKNNTNTYLIPMLRTGFFLFFYHFGYYYKTKIERKHKFNNLVYLLILIFVNLLLMKVDRNFGYEAWRMYFQSEVILVPIVASITGILFWVKVAEVLEPVLSKNNIICFIGNNTYDIMMHHLFFVFLLNTLILKLVPILDIREFNINLYKNTIYYFYYSGIGQYHLFFTFVAVAGPLIIRYLCIKINDKIKDKKQLLLTDN